MPSAGLTPPAPSLATAAEDDQPLEPPVLPEAKVSSALVLRVSPPLPSAWPSHGAPAPSGTLEEARAALDLPRVNFRALIVVRRRDAWG